MSFRGSLHTFALPEVLQFLASTAKSGQLRVDGAQGGGSLWFDTGRIAAFDAGTSAEAFEAVYELLRLSDGEFDFAVDDQPPETAGRGGNGDVSDAIERGQARLAEWHDIVEVVPSLHHQLRLVTEAPSDGVVLEPPQWSLIVAIGDGRSVGEVLERTSLREFEGCRAVREVVDAALVSVHEPIGSPAAGDGPAEPEVGAVAWPEADGDALGSAEAVEEPEVEAEPEVAELHAVADEPEVGSELEVEVEPDVAELHAVAELHSVADEPEVGSEPEVAELHGVAELHSVADEPEVGSEAAGSEGAVATPMWSSVWPEPSSSAWEDDGRSADDGQSLPGFMLRFGVEPATEAELASGALERHDLNAALNGHAAVGTEPGAMAEPVAAEPAPLAWSALAEVAEQASEEVGGDGFEVDPAAYDPDAPERAWPSEPVGETPVAPVEDRYAALMAAAMEAQEVGDPYGDPADASEHEGGSTVYTLGRDEQIDGRAALQALLSEVTDPEGTGAALGAAFAGSAAHVEAVADTPVPDAPAPAEMPDAAEAPAFEAGVDEEPIDGLADRGPWTEHELAVMDADGWSDPGEPAPSNIVPFAAPAPVAQAEEEPAEEEEEEEDAPPAEEPINRGLLLKFLSSVRN